MTGRFGSARASRDRGLTVSGSTEHEAYRLLPERLFRGTPTTYGTRTGTAETAEAARNDPNGFYHGVAVKYGRESFLLCGPPVRFLPEEIAARPGAAPEAPGPLQLSLSSSELLAIPAPLPGALRRNALLFLNDGSPHPALGVFKTRACRALPGMIFCTFGRRSTRPTRSSR
jgi:hypothetical protein